MPHSVFRMPRQWHKFPKELEVGEAVVMHGGGFAGVVEKLMLPTSKFRVTRPRTRHVEFRASAGHSFSVTDAGKNQACQLQTGEPILVRNAARKSTWQVLTPAESFEEHRAR